MSLTISNSDFYTLLNVMNQTAFRQQQSMLRLATGNRINSAMDDPSGLVALSLLNSELAATQAASDNATQANAMMNIADGALDEIDDLLTEIQGLAVEIANDGTLTEAEKLAKQVEIDQAVASIDSLVGTTVFNGRQLLNGAYAIDTSGVDTTKISDVDITGRGGGTASIDLEVEIDAAAEKGEITYSSGTLTGDVEIEIGGNLGTADVSLTSGMSAAQIASEINDYTSATGVEAYQSGGIVYIQSEHYGDSEFVTVDVQSGTFTVSDDSDYGQDATVSINGSGTAVNGYDVSFNVSGVTGTITLTESFASTASATETFTVGTGGATFALSSEASRTSTIGISDLGTTKLGNGTFGYLYQITSGGTYNALDHPGQANRIAETASLQIARTQANLGAFQSYTVQSMQDAMDSKATSLSSAISLIGDTDYALEAAALARQNVLMQAQISALVMTGQQSSSILSLLSV